MNHEAINKEMIAYAAPHAMGLGWKPVLLEYGTKRPSFKDWQERLMELREITYWTRQRAFGLGVHLGASGALVIDVDGQSEELDALLRQHGLDKPAMCVRSHKGVHGYWKMPETITEVRSRIHFLGLPLDVLMGKRVTVLPPTWIAQTDHRYALVPGTKLLAPSELPELPESFVELLNSERARESKPVVANVIDVTRYHAMTVLNEQTLNYIATFDPSVQGQNGSYACFVACLKLLTKTGGDTEAAWPMLLIYNATKCSPLWDTEAEEGPNSLRRKLREAKKCWKPK